MAFMKMECGTIIVMRIEEYTQHGFKVITRPTFRTSRTWELTLSPEERKSLASALLIGIGRNDLAEEIDPD